ncbi:MAG TPA: AAA family ATPase [Actinomycetota bacterium]|nr:AAA family ATPase [Actinomycetota bacterium]
MFLRSLQIRGFKSFAEKTTLEFVPGISVIVGPNGSGKSNLVDAISWVLGEQGPRALRGNQMADVIFAGSPQRPALGMAEVKLVIDNSAGLIPVPMSEIEVSRTIFRSGDSEYRIGGRVCRLLDVQELLSESGIGRALHTIVSQGQLEDVLTARPEERRRYIEEAAGIAKHRQRRERAERKLAGLEQDLVRLSDVLTELRRQLKPLKHQAEMAHRHEELTAEADAVAAKLATARLRELLSERDRRTGGWNEGLEVRKQVRERLDSLDQDVARAADSRASAVWRLQEAEALFRQSQEEKSSAERSLRMAVEAESMVRTQLATEASRHIRLTAMDEDTSRMEARLAEVAVELGERERELDEAERGFREALEARRLVEEERRRISEEAAAHRAEMETLRASLASHDRERARLEEHLGEVRRRRAAVEADRSRLREEVERLDGEGSPLSERKAAAEREQIELAERVRGFEEAERRFLARRELLEARKSDAEETPGSRFLASHARRAVGLLGRLVEAEEGWERALVAGLGPLADAVIYAEMDVAIEEGSNGEGATLAVVGGGPATFALPQERTLLSIVSADPAARGLVSTVLKDIYIAVSLEEAVRKQRRHPTCAFVTADGVLIGPAIIRTAPSASRGAEIARDLAEVEADLARSLSAVRPVRHRLGQAAAEFERLATRLEQVDAAITRAAETMARLETEGNALAREEESLGQRLAGVEDAAAAWRDRLAAAEPATHALPDLPRAPEPPIQYRVAVETLRRDRVGISARLASVRAERATLAAQDPEALSAALDAAGVERGRADERLVAAEAALESAAARREEAAAAEREATEAEAGVNRAWREASQALDRLREEYEEQDRVRGDLERRIRDAERLLREGHRAEPEEALAGLEEDDSVQAIERRAELVQRRLGLLGRVNLLAGGEFEAMRERHDFMARELDDIRKARRDLMQVVARIDEEIAATFAAAYADVAASFEALFQELFPGGDGRLVATDPEDILATGIEIDARPGRKRVKRISLLSGGERALTALAFLFAIFKARPSPFYLMDEVEPALDDVNLHRFLRLIRGFVDDSQVLIVTHQKRTMEVAQMMYGVSMSREGTSRVVGQRLDTPGEDPSADPGDAVAAFRGPDAATE